MDKALKSLIIKNGRVIDPATQHDGLADLWLENGLIKALDKPGSFGDGPAYDARGQWILPGLIDMHVHLRDPGHEYKEDMASGLAAAAAGGFTGVLAMPNTSPVLDSAELVRGLVSRSQNLGGARLWLSAAMTRNRQGQELNEYDDLKAAGAVAVTDDGSWVADSAVMRRILDYADVCGLLPLSHAEEPFLSKGGAINEGRVSTRLGLPGIPAQAEIIAIHRDIALAELAGRPLHICHVSTAGGVGLIRQAKLRGLKVSCETAPHYLVLTQEDVGEYNTNAKMNPPLRTREDQDALREALLDGTIDAIATDHAPHSILDKEVEFVDASFGIVGLESSLGLMLEVMRETGLTPLALVELMSTGPARLLRLPAGSLSPGAPADVTIIDPEFVHTFEVAKTLSKSRNSPFDGRSMKGLVVRTIVGGEVQFAYSF